MDAAGFGGGPQQEPGLPATRRLQNWYARAIVLSGVGARHFSQLERAHSNTNPSSLQRQLSAGGEGAGATPPPQRSPPCALASPWLALCHARAGCRFAPGWLGLGCLMFCSLHYVVETVITATSGAASARAAPPSEEDVSGSLPPQCPRLWTTEPVPIAGRTSPLVLWELHSLHVHAASAMRMQGWTGQPAPRRMLPTFQRRAPSPPAVPAPASGAAASASA